MALTKVKNSNLDDAVLDVYDTSLEVDEKISNVMSELVDSSPSTLNTIKEISDALGDDANHVTAMTSLIDAKLSPTGDGSQLINLPASGGVIEAVASGALAAGDKVILKTDGKVGVVGTTDVALTENFELLPIGLDHDAGSADFGYSTALNSDTGGVKQVYFVTDKDLVIVIYTQYMHPLMTDLNTNTESYTKAGMIMVGKVVDNDISWGTPKMYSPYGPKGTFTNSESNPRLVVKDDRFFIAYLTEGYAKNPYADGDVNLICGAINREDLTVRMQPSPTRLLDIDSYFISMAIDPFDNTRMLISGRTQNAGTHDVRLVRCNTSGTRIIAMSTYNAVPTNQAGTGWGTAIAFDPHNQHKFIVGYEYTNTDGYYLTTGEITSTNTISWIHSMAMGYSSICQDGQAKLLYDPHTSNRVMVMTQHGSSSRGCTFIIAELLSSNYNVDSMTYSTIESNVAAGNDLWGSGFDFDPNVPNKVLFSFPPKSTASGGFTLLTATISGTTITYGTPWLQRTSSTVGPVLLKAFHCDVNFMTNRANAGKFIWMGVAQTTTPNSGVHRVHYRLGQVAATLKDTNLNDTNFMGISDGAYSDGQNATIQITGSTNTSQSGLTIGGKYYVQGDGTLSTDPDLPKVFAGTALSTTNLLIKG
jgi:hypothetical protein